MLINRLNLIIRTGIYILILCSPLIYSLPCQDIFNTPKTIFFKLMILTILTVFIIKKIWGPEKFVFLPKKISYPFLLFIFFIALSFAQSKNVILAGRSFENLLFFIILFYIAYDMSKHIKLNKAVYFSLTSSLILSIIALFQYSGYDLTGVEKKTNVPATFLATTLGHRNYLGEYLLLNLPLLFSFYFLKYESRRSIKSIIIAVSIILFSMAILISYSRAVWLGTLFSIITYLYLGYKFKILGKKQARKISYLSIILIISLILFIIISPIIHPQQPILRRVVSSFKFKGSSLQQRLIIWNTTLLMIKENPLFGVGLGNFQYTYLEHYRKLPKEVKIYAYKLNLPRENVDVTHNEYLQIAAELGLGGLFAFFLLSITLFIISLKMLKRDAEEKFLRIAVLSAVAGIMVVALFSFPFHLISNMSILVVFLALLLKDHSAEEDRLLKRDKSTPLRIATGFILTFLFIILIIHLGRKDINLYNAQIHLRKGVNYLRLGKNDLALLELNKSLQLSDNGEAHFYKGIVLKNRNLFEPSYQEFKKARLTLSNLNLDFNLAVAAQFTGRYKEAKKIYYQILELYPWLEYQSAVREQLRIIKDK